MSTDFLCGINYREELGTNYLFQAGRKKKVNNFEESKPRLKVSTTTIEYWMYQLSQLKTQFTPAIEVIDQTNKSSTKCLILIAHSKTKKISKKSFSLKLSGESCLYPNVQQLASDFGRL